jgi:hypothetical protein
LRRKLRNLVLLTILCVSLTVTYTAAAQDDEDNYFAGTVVETAKDHLKISRVVQGKTEVRIFLVTAATKVEGGKLRTRLRVTVRFVTADEHDTATLVIIRPEKSK